MNLIKATLTVSFFTLISRITGFLRDMVIAAYVDKHLCDIFIISTKLGNMLRKVFAEGAFHVSFVPRFTEVLNKRGQSEAQKIASEVFTILCIAVCLICVFVITFYHHVLQLIAPSFVFGSLQYKFGIETGRICFWFLLFASLSAFFAGILNAYKRFALASSVQSIFNITILIAVLIGPLWFPNVAYTMSFSVVVAGILQTILLWYQTRKYAFKIKFRTNFLSPSPELKDIFKNMLPGILSSGVWQINMLVDMRMATSLKTGTVTYIHFADRINQMPLSLIGIAMGTSLLVAISTSLNRNKLRLANAQFNMSFLMVSSLTMPVLFSAFIMSPEIISVVFEHGKFTHQDVLITSEVLMGLLSGLPAYVLSKIYSAVFFASKDTKTPVKIGIISILTNILVLYTLTPIFAHIGIALATSISSWVNVILLHIVLKTRKTIKISRNTWNKIFMQILSVGLMSVFVYLATSLIRKHEPEWLLLMISTVFTLTTGFMMFMFLGHKLGGFNVLSFLKKSKRKN